MAYLVGLSAPPVEISVVGVGHAAVHLGLPAPPLSPLSPLRDLPFYLVHLAPPPPPLRVLPICASASARACWG